MKPDCWDAICYAAGTTRNGGSVTLSQSDCRELTAYVIQLTARGMADQPAPTAQLRAELAAAKEYGRRMASEMVFQEARADALQARWLRALADQPAPTETAPCPECEQRGDLYRRVDALAERIMAKADAASTPQCDGSCGSLFCGAIYGRKSDE